MARNNDLKAERLKILDLLSKNVINAEQAEKLLNSLGASEEKEEYPVQNK